MAASDARRTNRGRPGLARGLSGLALAAVMAWPCLGWASGGEDPAEPASTETALEADVEEAGSRLIVVPYPVVDPAIGSGLLAGPVWMREGPRQGTGPRKPQAFGAGAIWTDGGTRGVVAFDHRAWGRGTWRTTAVGGSVELHLEYTGLPGSDGDDLGFVIKARGASVAAQRPLGSGSHSVNFSAFSARTEVPFQQQPSRLDPAQDFGKATLSGVTLGWSHDTRDDAFLPSSGGIASAKATLISQALGASVDYQSLALRWTHYRPAGRGVFGLRGKSDIGFGTPPFYLRPYVSFRGVAALRYAGERTASLETEYRHPIRGGWSALAFASAGRAHSDFRGIERNRSVSAAGVGVRFRSERLFGLTFGVDVAQGPDGTVGYVQIGNAWTD